MCRVLTHEVTHCLSGITRSSGLSGRVDIVVICFLAQATKFSSKELSNQRNPAIRSDHEIATVFLILLFLGVNKLQISFFLLGGGGLLYTTRT